MKEVLFWLAMALKIMTVYFACIAMFTLKRKRGYPAAVPCTKFAVMVAARNEERVIANLIGSILRQNYPSYLRDVYVVPNNCTDLTETVAAAAGAKIIHCLTPVSDKGGALHQAVGQLLGQDYDAFVVFDADNVVHPDFLQRMNDAFCAGERVCKARQKVINPAESSVAGSYGLYFASFDWVFNRPRAACGLSAKLVGTGFAVHREVFEKLGGWNTGTIAEDAEFAVQCARTGYRVCWIYDALTYDEAPTSFAISLRQRKRWCSGVMQVGRQELGRLWKGEREHPMLCLDMTMFLLAPYAQAISGLLLFIYLALQGLDALPVLLFSIAAAYLGMVVVAMALCFLGGYPIREMGKSILFFPVFMASWLPLQILSLFKATKKWHAVPHTGEKAVEGIRL